MRTEAEWVRLLGRRFPAGGAVRVGIGDDAAVVAGARGRDWVFTTDLMIENIHFRRRWQPPQAVGWKALARSLSDVAAMGAQPRYALVALAVPPGTPAGWIKNFFAGLEALARRHRVRVIGGDLSAAAHVTIDVQAFGEVEGGRAVRRRGARPGDALFVSGTLGRAQLGLACLRQRVASGRPRLQRAVRAHFYPEPRVRLARALARRRVLTAMIDLSDGLSTDLHHLCEASGVGARVLAASLPTVRLPEPLARRFRTTPLALALHGGEDYELLFTVPARLAARLPARLYGVRLTCIGEITKGRGVSLVEADRRGRRRGRPLQPLGWDHFRREPRRKRHN
ncbi:MAG: thiamine-phosphate kinase [Terriglobia bacterium]